MYKFVLTHEVLPGKLPEMEAWFKERDAIRRQDPTWTRVLKRYITVVGSVHQVVLEFEVEELTPDLWERGWASGKSEWNAPGIGDDFLKLIVPGRSELRLLRTLDLDD